MKYDELLRHLQTHFGDGLVIVVGSGLSASLGLPTMWALQQHLEAILPSRLSGSANSNWLEISSKLKSGTGFEQALSEVHISQELELQIVKAVGELVEEKERVAIENVINGVWDLAFSRLLKSIMIPNTGLPVITSNYDRLLEFAAEKVGIGVDTMFVENTLGNLDQKVSKTALTKEYTPTKGGWHRNYREHISVYKPHGSMDWYLLDSAPVRCPLTLDVQRLMITPGTGKYLKGYRSPFDVHRDGANRAIDNARKLLIIGYGFNDEHLETHLRTQLERGIDCILLTRELTPNARRLVSDCSNVMAITHDEDGGKPLSVVTWQGSELFYANKQIWSLGDFVREVFKT